MLLLAYGCRWRHVVLNRPHVQRQFSGIDGDWTVSGYSIGQIKLLLHLSLPQSHLIFPFKLLRFPCCVVPRCRLCHMAFDCITEAHVARGDAAGFIEYVPAIALLFTELASIAACESSAFRGCSADGCYSPSRRLPSSLELSEDCCTGLTILEVGS